MRRGALVPFFFQMLSEQPYLNSNVYVNILTSGAFLGVGLCFCTADGCQFSAIRLYTQKICFAAIKKKCQTGYVRCWNSGASYGWEQRNIPRKIMRARHVAMPCARLILTSCRIPLLVLSC